MYLINSPVAANNNRLVAFQRVFVEKGKKKRVEIQVELEALKWLVPAWVVYCLRLLMCYDGLKGSMERIGVITMASMICTLVLILP